MRILHVVPTYLPATRYGGPIYSVHGLCKALAALGHDVEVCTTSVDGPGESDVSHDAPALLDGVRVRYFRSRTLRRLYYAPAMQRYLNDAMGAFDVVHLHSVFLWPTSMAARIAVARGVPYVVAPRGMLVPELIRQKSRFIKTAWLRLIEQRTLEAASGLHVTSPLEQRDAERTGLRLPAPFIVPNGVEPPAPSTWSALPASLSRWIGGEPYGLYVGRLNWKKGLDTLIAALGSTRCRIAICGDDDEGYGEPLRARARELGLLGDRIFFGGPVHGSAKWPLLAGARFLVLPSRHENFGNVVVEALSVGCPAVVTPGVGAQELVAECGAGLVVSGNASALAAAMQRLWEDDALRADMSGRGTAYVRDRLSWQQVARSVCAVYERLSRGHDEPA